MALAIRFEQLIRDGSVRDYAELARLDKEVGRLRQDLERTDTPFWSYFCQISDSTTSYGSYSGAVPNEKITWGKLGIDTPKFIIESDATIVAPLIFAYILDM